MKILISGATGLIGRRLCNRLISEGHRISTLTRHPDKAADLPQVEPFRWDPEKAIPPIESMAGVDAVVHLAGEPIAAKRWTEVQKRKIRNSRVVGTRNLIEGLHRAGNKPGVLVSGSAVGFYGHHADEVLTETARPATGFLVDICRDWEAEASNAEKLGIRVVLIRIGVVLSPEGGALPKMLLPFRLGLGGRLGSGRQWFPWIHIDDLVGIIHLAIFDERLSGPINGVAPGVITNAEFTKELAKVLHRPAFLIVPELALRIIQGEMATIVLSSQRVIPAVALQAGYQFAFPGVREALREIMQKKSGITAKAGAG
jgi:uncharacterized protein (TIGR01777 family)